MAEELDDRAPARSATDRPTVRRAERLARKRDKQYVAALTEVMATPAGRRVMWELLGLTGWHASPWSPDALTLAFNVGQQAVGKQLEVDLLRASEAHYETMEREMRAARRQDEAEDAAFQAERTAARRSEDETL